MGDRVVSPTAAGHYAGMTEDQLTAEDIAHVAGGGHLVLKLTRTNTWDEALEVIRSEPSAAEKVEARCDEIDPGLIEAMDRNTDVVEHQMKTPKVSTAVCAECLNTVMFCATLPKTCFLTRGCEGALVKPVEYTIAAKKPKEEEQA